MGRQHTSPTSTDPWGLVLEVTIIYVITPLFWSLSEDLKEGQATLSCV